MKILLEDAYKKVVNFLNQEKFEYIIIGGIACGTLGEPRVTADVEVDIILERDEISDRFYNCFHRFGKRGFQKKKGNQII